MTQNHDELTATVQQLLNMQPSEVQGWLEAVRDGRRTSPHGFNWLGLAQAAAAKARTGENSADEKTVPEWAVVAAMAYEHLARNAGEESRFSFTQSLLMMRAYWINRLGAVHGHPLLDVEDLLDRVERELSISLAEAEDKSLLWQELGMQSLGNGLTAQDMKELRRIKNLLAIIELLHDGGLIDEASPLHTWLSLREKLP